MTYYFEIPESTKKYQGKARTTLAVFIPEDLGNVVKNCEAIPVKQFASIDELNNLLIIAQDKKQWKSLINVICFAKDE